MNEITQGGRPKEGLDSLPPLWKDNILYSYSLGASDVEIKAWIYGVRGSFSNDLWERWMREEPEFSETTSTGRMIAEAFYHKIGRENLTNPRFNHQAWYLHMKNRFSWKDKLDITTGNEPINQVPDKELDKKIDDLIRKIAVTREDSADEESPD